jgi:hypothetical protein
MHAFLVSSLNFFLMIQIVNFLQDLNTYMGGLVYHHTDQLIKTLVVDGVRSCLKSSTAVNKV